MSEYVRGRYVRVWISPALKPKKGHQNSQACKQRNPIDTYPMDLEAEAATQITGSLLPGQLGIPRHSLTAPPNPTCNGSHVSMQNIWQLKKELLCRSKW